MKPLTQIIICLFWVGSVFYLIGRPPKPPPPFPEQMEELGPARSAYNPVLAAALDQGLRDFWQKPDQVLEALGSLEGLKVADIGCGEGYFTLRLLDLVGKEGKVFATDIQQAMLDTLDTRIPQESRDRVELVLGSTEDTGISEPVDLIFVIQVFGEVPNRSQFLAQLKRIMHARSRLVLIDSKHITDPTSGFTRPLNLVKLIRELYDSGFVFSEEYDAADFDFLPKQFFFVLRLGEG